MSNISDTFDEKYIDNSDTGDALLSNETVLDEKQIDDELYEIAKPKRIILRGRLINE